MDSNSLSGQSRRNGFIAARRGDHRTELRC